jgi:hypothetical protein
MADRNLKPDQPKEHGASAEQRGPHSAAGQVHPTHPDPGETAHRHELRDDERQLELGDVRVREHLHHQPSKGDPVIRAGDAGGPNDGRNLTTTDLDHDAGKPAPNVMERNAYAGKKPE